MTVSDERLEAKEYKYKNLFMIHHHLGIFKFENAEKNIFKIYLINLKYLKN